MGVDFKLNAGGKSACFGKDRLEMHEDGLAAGSRVLIIDDMLGTGSTMFGACELASPCPRSPRSAGACHAVPAPCRTALRATALRGG